MAWYNPADWDVDWKSALGGGASGAAAGSAFGPWGTAIGGVGGALLGGLAGGGEEGTGAEQQRVIDALWKQAEAGDPYAREQLRQATGRAMAQQQAMAATAAPQQQAMAARMAAQQAGQQQAAMAGQAALADIQARLGALGQLGDIATQQRQQDIANRQPSLLDYALQGASTYAQMQALKGGKAPGATTGTTAQASTMGTPGDTSRLLQPLPGLGAPQSGIGGSAWMQGVDWGPEQETETIQIGGNPWAANAPFMTGF